MRRIAQKLYIFDDLDNAAKMFIVRQESENDGAVGWCGIKKEGMDNSDRAVISRYLLFPVLYYVNVNANNKPYHLLSVLSIKW